MSVPHARSAWLLPILLVLAGPVRAERGAESYLGSISGLFARGEYERALDLAKKARRLEQQSVETEASLALWEGLLLAHLGKKEEATGALEEAFLLEPDGEVPARLSPKIRDRVESIRARVKQELASRPRPKTAAPAPRPVVATADTPRTVARPGSSSAAAPAWTPGAELAQQPSGTPVVPLVLGGVAVAAGATGAWFGIQSSESVAAAKGATYQDEASTLLDTASSQALAANVGFAVAGTAALVALVTLLVSR